MLIRPKLEYSSPIWNPHATSQIKNNLETVQHSATRFVKNYCSRNRNPADLITALGWPTLERRRIIKQANTDQYLNFASHHPKHQKLGVVRTLMHRCETITSEEGDKKEEVEHLREVLRVCGYPSWALNKVTDSCKKKKNKKKQMTEITGAK